MKLNNSFSGFMQKNMGLPLDNSLRELDRKIEECNVDIDDFKYFLRRKYGYGSISSNYEKIADYIKEFTHTDINFSYEKILKQYRCSIHALYQVELDMIEYNSICIIPEEKAIQDIRELLNLLEKKIKGNLGEQEKRSLEENTEGWKKDIAILRNYIEQEIGEK